MRKEAEALLSHLPRLSLPKSAQVTRSLLGLCACVTLVTRAEITGPQKDRDRSMDFGNLCIPSYNRTKENFIFSRITLTGKTQHRHNF